MADVVQHFLNPIIGGIHVSRCANAVMVKLVQQAQISCGVHPLLPASHGTGNAATPSKSRPDFVGFWHRTLSQVLFWWICRSGHDSACTHTYGRRTAQQHAVHSQDIATRPACRHYLSYLRNRKKRLAFTALINKPTVFDYGSLVECILATKVPQCKHLHFIVRRVDQVKQR